MLRSTWSVVVEALEMATAVGTIVCLQACAPAAPPKPALHVVPNRLANATLVEFEVVSFVDVDLHTAVQTREAVESEFHAAYERRGHPRWFFHAFDAEHLDFVVARFERDASGHPRYVAQRRLRVKRTRDAERALGVASVVHEYEIGMSGVKAGMSHGQVTSIAGPAQSWIPREGKGTFDLLYPTFCVRFAAHRVEHVWRRELCS